MQISSTWVCCGNRGHVSVWLPQASLIRPTLHPRIPNATLHKRAASAPAVLRTTSIRLSTPPLPVLTWQTSLPAQPLGSSLLWIHPTPAPRSHCPHFYSALQRPPGTQLPASLTKHHPPSILPGFFSQWRGDQSKRRAGLVFKAKLPSVLSEQTTICTTLFKSSALLSLPVRHPHQGQRCSCCQRSQPQPGRVWSWEGWGQCGHGCCRPQPGGGCGMQTCPVSLLFPGNS